MYHGTIDESGGRTNLMPAKCLYVKALDTYISNLDYAGLVWSGRRVDGKAIMCGAHC